MLLLNCEPCVPLNCRLLIFKDGDERGFTLPGMTFAIASNFSDLQ